ncbi:MAG TPA: hypothetical protein VM493_10240 [Vicinamibacterales bacterium]|nr:hypothetical protein [Vicinamibacterales bacterium]
MQRILLIAATMTACTGSPNYWRTYTPIEGQTQLDERAATQRAVIAVTDTGREIESSDAGVVLTKWFTGSGFGSDQQRFRIRVTIQPGAYEISALCQGKDSMTGAWNECEEQSKRPQFVLDTMSRIDGALK